MKSLRIVLIITVFTVVLVMLGGCTAEPAVEPSYTTKLLLDTNKECYPLYHSFDSDGQRIYGVLYDAMSQHKEGDIVIGTYETKTELEAAKDWINNNYRQIVYEQPDFFWTDPYVFTLKEIEIGGKYKLNIILNFTVDKGEYIGMKNSYDAEVDRIVAEAKGQPLLFDQILYVYDEILMSAEYDETLTADNTKAVDLSAYGALIDNKTVCSGYAMAFTSIMQKLGIECGVEFDTYSNFTIIGGHVWNYCKLEDEYYYFDLTWDDTGFDSEDYKPYMDFSHCYFGINADELTKSNFTKQDNAPTPDCNGTKYNYFVQKGINLADYDFDAVKAAIELQRDNKYIALRFDTYGGLIEAQSELIDSQKIYDILTDVTSLSYVTSKAGLHLYIFPK